MYEYLTILTKESQFDTKKQRRERKTGAQDSRLRSRGAG